MWWVVAKYIPFGTVGQFAFWVVVLVGVIHLLGGL